MHTPHHEIQDLVNLYRQRPDLFDDNQVLELERKSRDLNITFKPLRDNFSLEKTVRQFTTGFASGLTTLPLGDEPRSTYESIAHSLGHLAGFAPSILSVPIKGAANIIGKAGAKSLEDVIRKRGDKTVRFFDKISVPMMASRSSTRLMNKGLERLGANSKDFLRRGSISRNMADHAIGLASASAISNVWQGFDGMYDGFIHGAVAGGAFGGVGNFVRLGNIFKNGNPRQIKIAEDTLKTTIGAAITGLPSTLREDPIEMQLYEYILGGYFGYKSRPAHEAEGSKYWQSLIYSEKGSQAFRPETHPDWSKYSKKAQDYVNKGAVETSWNYVNRNAMEDSGTPPDIIRQWINERAKFRGITPDEMIKVEAADYYNNKFKYISNANIENSRVDIEVDMDNPLDHSSIKEDIIKKHRQGNPDNDVYVLEVGKDNNAVLKRVSGDYYGNKITQSYKNKPANITDDYNYIELTNLYLYKENPSRFNRTLEKPLQTRPRKIEGEDGVWVAKVFKHINNKAIYNLQDTLHNKNKYIFGGIKDKGVFNIREYHPDSDVPLQVILDALGTKGVKRKNGEIITPDIIGKSFSNSFEAEKSWLGSKDFLKKEIGIQRFIENRHEKAWKSNVLVEAERNGYYIKGSRDFSNIHKILKDGHSKNVIDWNKREQLYHDKGQPLTNDMIKNYLSKNQTNILRSAVFKDPVYEEYIDLKGKKHFWNSDVDGTIVFRPRLFNEISESFGYPLDGNMNKPVIVMKIPNGGTLAVKSAGYKASRTGEFDKPILDYMRGNNLDILMFESATKHLGDIIKPNEFSKSNLDLGRYVHKGELSTFDLTPESIRLNLGVFQNPSRSISTSVVKQLFGVFNEQQTPGMAEHVFNTIFEPSIKGKTYNRKTGNWEEGKQNKNVKEFLKTGDESLIEKINVDNIDVKLIHEAFITNKTNHQKLAKLFAQQILKINKEGKTYEGERVDLGETDYSDYINRNKLLMSITEGSQFARESFKPTRKFWENTYKRYIIERYLKPKWKYSAKGWLAPKLPHLRYTSEIKPGTFKLDDGFKSIPVKVDKPLGNIKNLGELWNAYQNFLKKGTVKPEKKKAFEDALEIALIRVPSDSIAGTRILSFKGFTGKKGYSIYTNAKDNSYIGGADKDSDSAFMYQGFDKKIKNAFKSQKNEWEVDLKDKEYVKFLKEALNIKGDVKDKGFIDSKAKALDKLFDSVIKDEYTAIESKFSPSYRKLVAESSRKGQQGVGYGQTAKNRMLVLYDYINKAKGKKEYLDIPYTFIDAKGITRYKTVRIKLKDNGDKWIRLLGRELVNRSADSADYSRILDYSRFEDLLMNKAFEVRSSWGKKFNKQKSEVEKTASVLNNTKINDIRMIFNTINNKVRSGDRTATLDEFQVMVENSLNNKRFDHIIPRLSDAMYMDGVHKSISGKGLDSLVRIIIDAKQEFIDRGLAPTDKNKPLRDFYRKLTKAQNIKIGESKEFRSILKYIETGNKDVLKGINWEKVRDYISNDLYTIASHRALARKGMEIYNELEKSGYKNPEEILTKILNPIAKRANQIKKNFMNIDVPENMTDLTLPNYDRLITEYKKIDLAQLVKKNKKGRLNQQLLEDYFDLWLTSPFMYIGKNQEPYRSLATPFGSEAINLSVKKSILSEFDTLYSKIREGQPLEKKDVLLPFKKTIEPSTIKTAEELVSKVPGLQKFSRKAITEEQYKVVNEFTANLKNMPRWTKNFEDMFINWQIDTGITLPKVAADITINDMRALNRFWFDLKKNPRNPELKSLYYYADRRTVDKKMQDFDFKLYSTYTMKVKSGDSLVKRKVKRGFSTLGIMREWFNNVLYLENANLDKSSVIIKTMFKPLESLSIKDANTINDIVANKRKFGEDYLLTDSYKNIENKIYKVGKKEYKGSELVELTDKAYTRYFKEFADKWIYANVDWSKIDGITKDTITQIPEIKLPSPTKYKSGVTYYENVFTNISNKYESFKNLILRTGKGTLGGKITSAWYGDVPYEYSAGHGKMEKHKMQIMPEEFKTIARQIEKSLGLKEGYFNSALVNVIKKGKGIGAHSDSEAVFRRANKTVGKVATVSFGGDTKITITGKQKPENIIVKDGSLYVMPGQNFQLRNRHAVGPSTKERISLTFRHIPKNRLPKKDIIQLNEYLKYNKDGSLDIMNFIKKSVETVQSVRRKDKDPIIVPMENILRFHYEYLLEKIISQKAKNNKIKWKDRTFTLKEFRTYYRTKHNPFQPLGKHNPETYFPQMNHNRASLETWKIQEAQKAYDQAIANKLSEKEAIKASRFRYEQIEFAMDKRNSNTPMADEVMDSMLAMGNLHALSPADISTQLKSIGTNNRASNLQKRGLDMPFYDTTTDVINTYTESIIRSYYKNLGAVMANYRIDNMVKRKPFPSFTEKQDRKFNPKHWKALDKKLKDVPFKNFRDWNDVWADYLRFYVRDSFGHSSTFPERIANSMSQGDPLKLKKNLYYGMSDQAIINAIEKLRVSHEKRFKMPLPFLGNVPKDKKQRADFYKEWIHKMGSMEARYELMTLLANSGVMVGNLYGGSTLNISSTGLRNFGRAINMSYLTKNILNDSKGNPLYFYKNPNTGRKTPVKTRKDLYAWMAEKGVIDNFLQYELQLNSNLKGKGKNVVEFMKELKSLWKKNPEVSDETVHSLAKKYKVYDTMIKYGGWFMQKSERILRLNAFMSHSLQAMDAYGKYAKEMRLDDPYIMEFGLRGIEATQFLYHSPNRPAFMSTSLGKVMTRFKLFVFNSLRVRKELYKQAKYYGFKEGTEQFERFKDLMFIDMMTWALGSMFAYSLFDTALSPPWDFLQETSEWLFGDKRERERAFFGQYPYPIAPLGYVTPPIARIPKAFVSVLNGDHEKFLDYHIHTMYPFGRMVRQVDKTFDEPYGTTFGRGMQQFFRLPTDKLKRRIDKAKLDDLRKESIENILGE